MEPARVVVELAGSATRRLPPLRVLVAPDAVALGGMADGVAVVWPRMSLSCASLATGDKITVLAKATVANIHGRFIRNSWSRVVCLIAQ
jgi:hypothetical protein